MTEKYQSPKSLPDEYMRLVGIISAHWEWTELVLQRLVAEVMDFEYSRVALLTTNISFHAHCDLLMIYARPLETEDPDAWKEFVETHTDLKRAYLERNKFIHAKWKVEPNEPIRRAEIRTRNGKLSVVDEPVSETELVQAAKAIWHAGERLHQFGQRFGLLMKPLPNISALQSPQDRRSPDCN